MFIKFLKKLPGFSLSTICVIAILYLTLVPKPLPETDIQLFPHADKLVHAIMFGGLFFCLYVDMSIKKLSFYMVAAFSVIVFGGLIEIAQQNMGMGRGGDWLDFAADTAGVIISFIITPHIWRKLNS